MSTATPFPVVMLTIKSRNLEEACLPPRGNRIFGHHRELRDESHPSLLQPCTCRLFQPADPRRRPLRKSARRLLGSPRSQPHLPANRLLLSLKRFLQEGRSGKAAQSGRTRSPKKKLLYWYFQSESLLQGRKRQAFAGKNYLRRSPYSCKRAVSKHPTISEEIADRSLQRYRLALRPPGQPFFASSCHSPMSLYLGAKSVALKLP